MSDLIDRQTAIAYAISGRTRTLPTSEDGENWIRVEEVRESLLNMPSAEPTLYGYSIEHLELIARVLQKEDLPPERVVEALTDIDRIVAIVKDEFEKSLRKAVEQCTI